MQNDKKKMHDLAKSMHLKYSNGQIEKLERFMNSIFYPPKNNRNDLEKEQFS
jgi:hypothetical protein